VANNNDNKKKERSSVSRSVCVCVCVCARARSILRGGMTIFTRTNVSSFGRRVKNFSLQSSKSTQNNFKQKARKNHRATQRKTAQNIASRIVVGAVTSKEAFKKNGRRYVVPQIVIDSQSFAVSGDVFSAWLLIRGI